MKKIYLAIPYSHELERVRHHRFGVSNQVSAALIRRDRSIVFSPISMTHPIAEVGELPLGWDFWEKFDRAFIEWADELWVVCIDGWEESTGVQAEIKIAEELEKPVIYLTEDKLRELLYVSTEAG